VKDLHACIDPILEVVEEGALAHECWREPRLKAMASARRCAYEALRPRGGEGVEG
jgi:hypothetical protein